MIIKLEEGSSSSEIIEFKQYLENYPLRVDIYETKNGWFFGILGDESFLDLEEIQEKFNISEIISQSSPYKKMQRQDFKKETIIELENGHKIGGGHFTLISGPCSVESEEQIVSIALALKEKGADILRGGAFKPRTSPYSFQGKGPEGLKAMIQAKKESGLPIVTEIMDPRDLKYFEDVDILQIGARNSQHFPLLKEVGKTGKPVLLKRGIAGTIDELLMSAEYIMSEGNEQVILCERGIRTFETATRNTLDISAVPVLKDKTHLPIIVDPSHAVGIRKYVEDCALASVAAGAHGLMVETHEEPDKAFSDGQQCLTPNEFGDFVEKARKIRKVLF